MLTFFQSLKVYLFIVFLSSSVILSSFFLLFILLYLISYLLQEQTFFLAISMNIILLTYMISILILMKELFFSCISKQFNNFILPKVDRTWKNYLKIYGVTLIVTTLFSQCIEILITAIEKGGFYSSPCTTKAMIGSIIADFLFGSWFFKFWFNRNTIGIKTQ